MIDSHCHLDHTPLHENLSEVIKRSKDIGIETLLTISTTTNSFKNILSLIKFDPMIYGTFGIHPHETEKHTQVDSKFILNIKKKHNKIIGIGETGLDFYYNYSSKKIQKKSFIEHISAASLLNIPIIVHSRNAEMDTYEILKSEMKNSNLKVLLHCFTGSKNFAKKLIDLNCYISVSGIITFKNSLQLANTVCSIPIENLLVETDSPYLSPLPHRGKSNEPSFIVHTVDKLSEIKKTSKEIIMTYTTKNFKNLFGLS